ncbi:helix-turn-helix domain-containing protein [Nocardia stercoris]|uniref:LysR family transcriptional regulator n=1 Tax=Nocardia stercoris TaxID=2483361 RepID=A0A3M2L3W3_9NOCA|nr:LysR family transcriptional regulator [Nocardia stercoris]
MGEFTVVGLRVVRAAARTGSSTRAAERLRYTQSAESRQVTLVEHDCTGRSPSRHSHERPPSGEFAVGGLAFGCENGCPVQR